MNITPRCRLAGAVVTAVLLSGCGSSASSTAPQPTSTGDLPSSTHTVATFHGVARVVAATFTEFFAGSTPADRKVTLVQDGSGFAQVIQAQAGGAMSQSTTVEVSRVTVTGPTRAEVRYTILMGGTPALENQVGAALKEGGHWVVGAATFCRLLSLEQSAPALCRKFS